MKKDRIAGRVPELLLLLLSGLLLLHIPLRGEETLDSLPVKVVLFPFREAAERSE